MSQNFRQSRTSHLFIIECAPRAPSENKGVQFTSIMWDVITYPCDTCVQHAYTITSPQYFWSMTTYDIYACRWKYTTSFMTFWPSDSQLLMKVFLCDSLLFECEKIKYWIFVFKVKVPIISKSIVSCDARISNYTTTASPQGFLWDVINHTCASI